MNPDFLPFTLSLDFSKSTQDPPEMIRRIMEKSSFQSAFLVEGGGAFPWPDTLEILLPELAAEEGAPDFLEDELPRPGTAQPTEDIARSIIYDLRRSSVQIPTLFFVHEEITVALIAGDLYRMAFKGAGHEERAQRINERNAMLPLQTPALESAKMRANATRYTVREVAQETGVSKRDSQRAIVRMREEGLLPKELISPRGRQLFLSADEFARVCTYIRQGNRKRGRPKLSQL